MHDVITEKVISILHGLTKVRGLGLRTSAKGHRLNPDDETVRDDHYRYQGTD